MAFSCKGRGLCPSCGAKRAAELAAFLVDEVVEDVGHAQWVFTIPKTVDTYGRWLPMGNKAAMDRLDESFATPDDLAGSRMVATAPRRRRRRPQVVEGVARPRGFEPLTYRFVVCRSIQLS